MCLRGPPAPPPRTLDGRSRVRDPARVQPFKEAEPLPEGDVVAQRRDDGVAVARLARELLRLGQEILGNTDRRTHMQTMPQLYARGNVLLHHRGRLDMPDPLRREHDHYRRCARTAGLTDTQSGTVTAIQRFGGWVNGSSRAKFSCAAASRELLTRRAGTTKPRVRRPPTGPSFRHRRPDAGRRVGGDISSLGSFPGDV